MTPDNKNEKSVTDSNIEERSNVSVTEAEFSSNSSPPQSSHKSSEEISKSKSTKIKKDDAGLKWFFSLMLASGVLLFLMGLALEYSHRYMDFSYDDYLPSFMNSRESLEAGSKADSTTTATVTTTIRSPKPTNFDGSLPLIFNREKLKPEELSEDQWTMTLSDLTFQNYPGFKGDKNRTQIGVENATLYMLVRNSELYETLKTMRDIESRFNRHYRYPWTFLNDVPFTEEFKILTTGMASGKTEYGLVPKEFWSLPDHIDPEVFNQTLRDYEKRDVIYGGSVSYRHMCRFNSGFFFRHPLMLQYDWYWRVEPDTRFYCDQLYDPFTFMRVNNKTYGFVIALPEYEDTIPTLWDNCETFFNEHPEYIAPNNAGQFIFDKSTVRPDDMTVKSHSKYNLCHFWSNFEIANLNFFRSERYMKFFEHLDKAGGFFYERWGDAPVHSIALTLMLNSSEIHHFSDIGYKHIPYYRCPHDLESYTSGRCFCEDKPADNVDFAKFSCLPKWWLHGGRHFLYKYEDQLIIM